MILSVCANPSVDSFWHIDQIKKKTTNRSAKESFFPGGKGIHVALALNELGQEVTSLGIWGGQTGQWLRKKCLNHDVNTIGPTVDQWTRICLTLKSSSEWSDTELIGGGPEVNNSETKEFIDTYQQFIIDKFPKAVTISGSVPGGIERDLYFQLLTIADSHGIPTFLDASGELLKKALKANPYCIHINQHEGKELYGSDNPLVVAKHLSSYCSIAAVTAGADGLYLQADNKLFHASHKIDPSRIRSTVGSGDCLLAGLCSAILRHESPDEWAKYGVACGSANCLHPQLGMLCLKDVQDIVKNVNVEIIQE